MSVQMPTCGAVVPDMAVDGFVADQQEIVLAQISRNLLGAPLLFQVSMHGFEMTGRELCIAPRAGASISSAAIRFTRAIRAICGTRVSSDLTRNRTRRPIQFPSNVGLRQALLAKRREHIPLSRGELVIRHD